MSRWIILLTCALTLTACNSMSGKPTTSGGYGSSGTGSGSGAAAVPDTGAMPVYPASTPSGSASKPESQGTAGSSERPASSGGTTTMPESSGSSGSSGSNTGNTTLPMPSGSGAGGIYEGGSSNNPR